MRLFLLGVVVGYLACISRDVWKGVGGIGLWGDAEKSVVK